MTLKKGKIRENIDFSTVNTPPANTTSSYSGCNDLARNMAAVGARALHPVRQRQKDQRSELSVLYYSVVWIKDK